MDPEERLSDKMPDRTQDDDQNPFWRFSLIVYGRPGVASACISLQDRLGLDVNLLLFLCWTGALGHAVEHDAFVRLMERAARWQRLVARPLREVRRGLKGQDLVDSVEGESFRSQVKALELEAERLEQAMLYSELTFRQVEAPEESVQAAACAARNIALYLRVAGIVPRLEDVADLAAVLRGGFPRLHPLEAVWMLRL